MAVRSSRSASLSTKELERAMAATPLLQDVPSKAVAHFASLGAVREYRRGTYLFFQGDDADSVLFLCRGRIEISSLSFTGHRQLLTTLDHPQFFGELGVLGDLERTSTAMALEDTVVWLVRGEVFLGFLGEHFDATRALLRSLSQQIHAHESFVEDLLYLDLKGRVAKRLLQLVSPSLTELPPDGTVLPAAVTHSDLASLVGGSRENVTRILSDFQRRRLVKRDGKRYVLTNVTGLRRLASL
ncbi:MAG: Crp/Fnr family transcriptional regulator [Actinomycetota bacterium]|nr:Crp/Fnr family transcriptional regulator [Actinomycetota bacterium]